MLLTWRALVPTQERMLGEDGNPRRTRDAEDPFHSGLVLEWVYGTIVSTAEKARDSAKKPLGARLFWLRAVRARLLDHCDA